MQDDCHIIQVPKPRNGKLKFWCLAHNASATARFGGKLNRCEGAYRTIADFRRFKFDPQAFPGGVALWGAVEPVYNSTKLPAERGIHVHARKVAGSTKQIDETFDAVELVAPADLFREEKILITGETAVAYYLCRFSGHHIEALFCSHCGTPHLDSDWFAVKPHRTHLCHNCNQLFKKNGRSISNPLEAVRLKLGDSNSSRRIRRAKSKLVIEQKAYPGGLQIWASNPAILWTAPRAEEEGIHVHAWTDIRYKPKIDGTFDAVTIDGIDLNEEYLKTFMAQNALKYLKNKVVSLECPQCSQPVFETNDKAFRPRKFHTCQFCANGFNTPLKRKIVVSNPFVSTISQLEEARKNG